MSTKDLALIRLAEMWHKCPKQVCHTAQPQVSTPRARFGASPLLCADTSENLWRRGLPQSPEKRQDVVTSITDAIPICFLSCKGEINTHTCGLYTEIFLDSQNSSESVQYHYLWDMQFFWMHFCLSCPIALTSPKFSEIFLNILM